MPPDAGKPPPFAKLIDEGRGVIGTDDTYSGQEYDTQGQADWRVRQNVSGCPMTV